MKTRRKNLKYCIDPFESRILFSTIYVDVNTSGASHDGTAWSTAFVDLQQALVIAGPGDEIHVADGTYLPSTTDVSERFRLMTTVNLFGGFAGDGSSNPDERNVHAFPTLLSGAINALSEADVVFAASGVNAIAELDGFTITRGRCGARIEPGASVTFKNCSFTESLSAISGWRCSVLLFQCAIDASRSSAAIYSDECNFGMTDCSLAHATTYLVSSSNSVLVLRRCEFSDYGTNTPNYNNQVYAVMEQSDAVTIEGCTFTSSQLDAHAIYNYRCSRTITDCAFTGLNRTAVTLSLSNTGIEDCLFEKCQGGSGGAIYVRGSTSIITNCRFTGNRCRTGGAVYNELSSPIFNNCIFTGNEALEGGDGGAIYNQESPAIINSCTFTNNFAGGEEGSANSSGRGGAIFNWYSSPSISNTTFTGNAAMNGKGVPSNGGAIYNYSESRPAVDNCNFLTNSLPIYCLSRMQISKCNFTANSGTCVTFNSQELIDFSGCNFTTNNGRCINLTQGLAVLTNCSFKGNNGGGILNRGSASLTNCVFIGNFATTGGAISNGGSASLVLAECTLANNSAVNGGGISNTTSSVTASNCILWGNAGTQLTNTTGLFNITYSDVQAGYAGVGNINFDPQFVREPSRGSDNQWGTADDDYGDLRLQAASYCVDAGNNAAVPLNTKSDFSGNPRIVDVAGVRDYGEIVDMGAYERTVAVEYLFNADKPSLRFTFEVALDSSTLDVSDLSLLNAANGQSINFSAFTTVTYDPDSKSATWRFEQPLPDGDYRAVVLGGRVKDTDGVNLSADLPGNFFVKAGDGNRDRKVDIKDLALLAANWQGSGKAFSQGDFNYDGRVDAKDLGILSARWGSSLLPPPAVQTTVLNKPAAKRAPARVAALIL